MRTRPAYVAALAALSLLLAPCVALAEGDGAASSYDAALGQRYIDWYASTYPDDVMCQNCHGCGVVFQWAVCRHCHGAGVLDDNGSWISCPDCNGRGYIQHRVTCPVCKGNKALSAADAAVKQPWPGAADLYRAGIGSDVTGTVSLDASQVDALRQDDALQLVATLVGVAAVASLAGVAMAHIFADVAVA